MDPREVQVLTCCLGPAGESGGDVPRIAYDGDAPSDRSATGVVLIKGPEIRARELLQAGVPRVFLGEAALKDASIVERLAAEFGVARGGVFAPAKTPKPVIDRLNAVFAKAMQSARFQEFARSQTVDVVGGSPAEFAEFLKNDRANAGRVFKAIGVRPGDAP